MALPSKVKRGDPITADFANSLIDSIKECQIQAFVGGSFKRGTDGTTLTIQPSSKKGQAGVSDAPCPFTVTIASISAGQMNLNISAGLVNGTLPSNILETVSSATSGLRYVVVECETDGRSIVSSGIVVDSSPPTPQVSTPDTAPETFKVLIAVVSGGETIYRTIPCDNITARIAPSIQESSVTYTAGNRNYTQYYNWVF